MEESNDNLCVGIDLGTSRSSISASNGERYVIEAHDADVTRHRPATASHRTQRPDRHQVVVGEDRGHTGRPLVADRFEVACYVLVVLAAMLRVVGGMLLPDAYRATVVASGICWSAAFALYAVRYWPVLSRPRLDGKPG